MCERYTGIGILVTMNWRQDYLGKMRIMHELYINVAMVKHSEYDFAGEARNSGQ